MQKLINVLAVTSFVVSAGVVVGATYLYTQRDALKERATEQVTELITGAVSGAVGDIPNLLDGGPPAPSSPVGPGVPMPF